jgi:hypothetical protein
VTIATSNRPLRIAVINISDPSRDAMKYYFQGSAGAQTTFCMLVATLMQPHLRPPLLDGLILLYNGEMFSELDHIDLTGIITPRSVAHLVSQAIGRGKPDSGNNALERKTELIRTGKRLCSGTTASFSLPAPPCPLPHCDFQMEIVRVHPQKEIKKILFLKSCVPRTAKISPDLLHRQEIDGKQFRSCARPPR